MFRNKFLENDRTLKNLDRKMKQKISELLNKTEITKKSELIEEEYLMFEELETLEEDCEGIIEQIEDEQIYETEIPEAFEESSKNEIIEVDFDGKFNENCEVLESFYCEVCSFHFNDQNSCEVQKHLQEHENGKNICCMQCSELFSSTKSMQNHQIQFHKEKSCKKCKLKLDSVDHQCYAEKRRAKKTYMCYVCKKTFIKGIDKKQHVQQIHKNLAGKDCPLCIRCKIPSAVAYENHYKIHFIEPEFFCNFCSKSFFEADRLQTHIKRFHNFIEHFCDICGKSFRDKSGINRHMIGVHLNRRDHCCEICSKAFTTSYNLAEHMFSVHKKASKFYTCNLCERNFLYRKQFERHRNQCSPSK